MFVRIDRHRVAVGYGLQVAPGVRCQLRRVGMGQQRKKAAVGGVDVHPAAVATAERQRVGDRIDHPAPRRAGRQHDGSDASGAQHRFERLEVHAPFGIGGHLHGLKLQDAAHAAVRVMRFPRKCHALVRVQAARHPERFQVGHGTAAGQVPERGLGQVQHGGQRPHHLFFHRTGGRSAVQRVVVRVDELGRQIADHGDWMGRLEHLPGIARMEEGIVSPQTLQVAVQRCLQLVRVNLQRRMRRVRSPGRFPVANGIDRTRKPGLQVHFSHQVSGVRHAGSPCRRSSRFHQATPRAKSTPPSRLMIA